MPTPDHLNLASAMIATHLPEVTVSVREAAEHFGRCEETIRRWLRSGWLEGRKSVPGSRAWLVVIPKERLS